MVGLVGRCRVDEFQGPSDQQVVEVVLSQPVVLLQGLERLVAAALADGQRKARGVEMNFTGRTFAANADASGYEIRLNPIPAGLPAVEHLGH